MKSLFLVFGLVFMVGCASGPQILTVQASDPEYSFKDVKTIGLAPYYWTKEGKGQKVDQLIEKAVLGQVKLDLEKRGFKVEYLPKESLYESTSEVDGENVASVSINPKKLGGQLPQLLMIVRYGQELMKNYVPAQFQGAAAVGTYFGSANTSGHEGYNTLTYDLSVSASLWAGQPQYAKRVWQGSSKINSNTPEFTNRSWALVQDLLAKTFDQQKCYYDWQLKMRVGDCGGANSEREMASGSGMSVGGQ